MIFWIITVIITFFLLRWVTNVPCVIPDGNFYKPIGMKLWILLLIIVVSLIPILNLIIDLAAIVAIFVYKQSEDMDYDDLFPDGPGKIMSFLNKKL